MNRKVVKTVEEVDEFIEPLATGEFVIDIKELPNKEGYSIEWQTHKTYTAFADGKVYPDELWRTEDGRLLLVQDLEPEHCRNILRMILRKERETETLFANLLESILGAEDDGQSPDSESIPDPEVKTLH